MPSQHISTNHTISRNETPFTSWREERIAANIQAIQKGAHYQADERRINWMVAAMFLGGTVLTTTSALTHHSEPEARRALLWTLCLAGKLVDLHTVSAAPMKIMKAIGANKNFTLLTALLPVVPTLRRWVQATNYDEPRNC